MSRLHVEASVGKMVFLDFNHPWLATREEEIRELEEEKPVRSLEDQILVAQSIFDFDKQYGEGEEA
jgi:hypothetical protein